MNKNTISAGLTVLTIVVVMGFAIVVDISLPPALMMGSFAGMLTLACLGAFLIVVSATCQARRLIRMPWRRPPGRPQLMPAPERSALPPVPLVVVLGDMYWQDAHMGEQMMQELIRVARGHGEIGREAVRELEAARRVVKGDVA